jgi:enediyne biosynthesis protein E4
MNNFGHNSLFCCFLMLRFLMQGQAQAGHDVAPPSPAGLKTTTCAGRPVPQLEDITEKAGIHFRHTYSPEKKVHSGIHERRGGAH